VENNLLLAAAVLLPALSAALCYLIRKAPIRNFIVILTAVVLFGVAGDLVRILIASGGKISIDLELKDFPIQIGDIIKGLDFLLLIYIGYIGFKLRKSIIIALTIIQFVMMFLFEFDLLGIFGTVTETGYAVVIDYLSLIMILLVSIIGPIITIFAIGYMKEHEHHTKLKKSGQPRFFMVLLVFLGAMNALVMTDNLSFMYFFWEVTTLCSFLLISHDGTAEAIKNATKALWMNSLGGVAFITAIMFIFRDCKTLSIQTISSQSINGLSGLVPIALGLLCFAGFTKAAQFPFQSWLLGAMVAPTPVSALLHSSTMVKAGVYLIVRMSPAYSGTILANLVAVAGGFTFLAGSAIAISQSNGKRVLAYSTIANLGLIICCAGIGSPVAIGAAVMLMIFHAVSKGLLFLCIGTIEHGIGSRDIEDMQGLMKRMPFTTVITVIAMISMLLPPFGVLITKWLAIEAAVGAPLVLLLIILGSAFTVVFWSKWIGIILTMSYKPKYVKEKLPVSIRASLSLLFLGVLAASVGIVPLFNKLISPYISGLKIFGNTLGNNNIGVVLKGMNNAIVGSFASILFFIIIFVLIIAIPYFMRMTKQESVKPPYLCGENTDDVRGIEFMGPGEKVESVVVRNYYLSGFFGESNLTLWTNLAAGAIILVMFGVVIK
jgi:ech hydrogenase subunit A